MKKITVQKETFKHVSTGFKDVEVYETIDGVRHNSEADAIKYEQRLLDNATLRGIKAVHTFDWSWYLPKTEDEIRVLKQKHNLKNDYPQVVPGTWITFEYGDEYSEDDYDSTYQIKTLDDYKSEYDFLVKTLEEEAKK